MSRVVRERDPKKAVDAIRSWGRHVVTFSGFSGGGYEDPAAVERAIAGELARLEPAQAIICCGATADGIGAVYPLAKARGFETVGIVSSVAESEGAPFSDSVGTIFVIEDDTWGGVRGDGTLSPTSSAMVQAADDMIAIGGGAITRDEVEAARRLGKRVRYLPADMNHAVATRKAIKSGEAPPTDFKGAVDKLFTSA